jgi:hypothetical protein
MELRVLRGVCSHALGQHRDALRDYQAALEAQVGALCAGGVAAGCRTWVLGLGSALAMCVYCLC